MKDNGGALQTTVFQWTKRGEQVVQRPLCYCEAATAAESKASDTSKSPKPAAKVEKEAFIDGDTSGYRICGDDQQARSVCPASSD